MDYPLKVTLGSWLDRKFAADDTEVARLIETANANADVDRVLVGNEVLLRDDLSTSQLIGYIKQVKDAVHVPVSTAEPWHVWIKHPELAASVDYITIHLLPYWEGVPVDGALKEIMMRLDQVQNAYPGKHVVIGEVGWPSNGVAIGGAHCQPGEPGDVPAEVLQHRPAARARLLRHGSLRPALQDELRGPRRRLLGHVWTLTATPNGR